METETLQQTFLSSATDGGAYASGASLSGDASVSLPRDFAPAAAPARQTLAVAYRLNPDDLFAAQWHYVQTSPSIRRNYRIIFSASLLVVLCLTALLLLTGMLSLLFAALFYAVFAGLMVWRWPQACRDGVRRQVDQLLKEGRNAHIQGEIRMEIDAGGLRVWSAHGESRLTWETVERVDETAAHLFIRIGSTAQHVIPKWAFESRRRADEFVETARCFQRRAEFS
jgi:hypothetical protein